MVSQQAQVSSPPPSPPSAPAFHACLNGDTTSYSIDESCSPCKGCYFLSNPSLICLFSECQMLYDWDYDEAANTNSGFQVSEYSQRIFVIVTHSHLPSSSSLFVHHHHHHCLVESDDGSGAR